MARRISLPGKPKSVTVAKSLPEPGMSKRPSGNSTEQGRSPSSPEPSPKAAGPSPASVEPSPKAADPSTESAEPFPDDAEPPVEVLKEAGTEAQITATDDEIFGPLPAPPGEELENLNAILAALVEEVRPKDVIEKILVRDVAYLQSDLQRLRRLKANLATSAKLQGLKKMLADIDSKYNLAQWAERWVGGEPQALVSVPKILATAGLTEDAIADEAFMSRIDEIERVDRLIAQAEVRRAMALEGMRRHRKDLAELFEASAREFYQGRLDHVPEAPRRGGRR